MQAPALLPLDEVRQDVIAGWQRAKTEAALTAQADALAEALHGGAEFIRTVFDLDPNVVMVLLADGDAWIVRLDAVTAADSSNPQADVLKSCRVL